MRVSALIVALAGLAAITLVVQFAAQSERASVTTMVEIPPAPEAVPPAAPSPSRSVQESRVVRPEMVAPPLVASGQLERIEPRQPLGRMGNVDRHGSDGPKPTGLFQPVAVAAGIVQSKGYTVRLAGIDIVPAEERCSNGAAEWNCGIVARTAFRNFLRGRALSCILPDGEGKNVTIACALGKEDPALWLARNGWARGGEGTYAEAVAQARKERLGIFGGPPG